MSSTSQSLPDKPRPLSPPEHAPWWQALKEHRLVAQQCANCHRLRMYPRPMCDACYSMDYDWARLSGEGSVHSWCVSHHAFNLAFKPDLPYLIVSVDLKEGLRLHAPLRQVAHDQVALDMAVIADFEDADETYTTLCFKPAG